MQGNYTCEYVQKFSNKASVRMAPVTDESSVLGGSFILPQVDNATADQFTPGEVYTINISPVEIESEV